MSIILAFAQVTSADAAIQQAKAAGGVAKLGPEQVVLQQIGDLSASQPSNQSRDLANHLHKRGFMLNSPSTWLKNVLWHKMGHCFMCGSGLRQQNQLVGYIFIYIYIYDGINNI